MLKYKYIQYKENTSNMKLRTKINERAIDLDQYPGTYLSQRKKDVDSHKAYSVLFKEIIQMLKDMSWKDIKFVSGGTSGGTRIEFPLLPEPIRAKIKSAARVNNTKAISDFRKGNFSFAKTFNDNDPDTTSNIFMKVESEGEGQRSHFPNDGIPVALRGTNLGYKLYRALLEKYEYLRTNTGGTISKDYAWQSIVSPKKDAGGNLTEDDVHAIVGTDAAFAMIKTIPKASKIKYATNFINRAGAINKSGITKTNFAIDDELKAILPKELVAELDPTKREAAEKARREREETERREREAAALRSHGDRFELYAPFGVDAHDWEVGDYIVVKRYLMETGYNELPVRKVVEKTGNEYTAIKISDIASYEANGTVPSNDPRKTRNKTEWVKTKLKRGQYGYMEDPSAGRLVVKGGSGRAGRSTPVPVNVTQPGVAGAPDTAQESAQKKIVRSFMRTGPFDVYIKTADWESRSNFARRREPIVTYLVKKNGVGRSATYKVMNGRTGEQQNNISNADFLNLELKKFDIAQLERKSSVREGDWVFVKDHRGAQGLACVVKNVTPASNRQPGLYIWTGDTRPQYIGTPPMLWKLIESTNDSLSTSIYRFDELIESKKIYGGHGILTKDKAKEMLEFLDANGEHKLVSQYKNSIRNEDIDGIIGAWATSIKTLPEILEDFWKTYQKIHK